MFIDSMKKKRDYVFDEMLKMGWDDRNFITEQEIMDRWRIDKPRTMRELIYGNNAKGVKLPCLRITNKARRFRPSDVLEFEYEVLDW